MASIQQSRRIKWVSVHIALVLLLILTLYPVYWVLQISLKTQVEAFRVPPSWIFKPTFVHFRNLLIGGQFPGRMLNSLIISTFATLFALIIGTPAAYVFSRLKFRFKNLTLILVLASRMIPPIAFIIPYFLTYVKIGLIDTRTGLIIIRIGFSLGLVVWSMWTYIDEIPIELDEAAEIDGASVLQILRKVILPISAGGLTSTGILCFVAAWNDYLFALILTRTRAVTAPVEITKALAYQAEDLGIATAGAIVVAIPAIFFSLIVRRYLKAGVMGGAVKG
jgi:multiple sugar transport system permease protein